MAWTPSKSGVYSSSQIKFSAAFSVSCCCCCCCRSHLTASHCNSNESQITNFSLSNAPHYNVSVTACTFCADPTSPKKKNNNNNSQLCRETRPPLLWSECRGVPDGTMQRHCHNERITYRANATGPSLVPRGDL